MNSTLIGFICLALSAGAAGSAMAANELVILDRNTPFNKAETAVEGDGNRLRILQEGGAAGAVNELQVSLRGDDNGGPPGVSFSGAALEPGLTAGTIQQVGLGNALALTVEGSGNLFAFVQNGYGNGISGTLMGQANQAVVVQEGNNNYSSFSQKGIGNIISIVQR